MKLVKLIGYRSMALCSQNDIAQVLGVSYPTYNAKENGKNAFTDKEKKIIKDFLSERLGRKFTIDELFF